MSDDRLRIEYLPLDDLLRRRHPRNPKDHALEELDRSMSRFGYTMPVAVDEATGNLAAGHGRVDGLEARRQEGEDPPARVEANGDGEWLVPTIRGLTFESDDELLAYLLADNMLTEAGGWMPELLAEDVEELLDRLGEEDALAGTGIDDAKLEAILSWDEEDQELEEDDYDPEPVEAADSEPGEIYDLGPHRLACGDVTDPDIVEALMDGAPADLVLTDPPYNVSVGTIKHDKFRFRPIENDDMSPEDYRALIEAMADRIEEHAVDCVYVCHAPNQDGRIVAGVLDDRFHCSTTIVWRKDAFVLGRGKYQNAYEPIWFGWVESGRKFSDRRDLSNVWEIPRPKASEDHPTMKPVDLFGRAIQHASAEGDVVLDLFAGSGTTMVAAEKLGRRCFMLELSPHYCDVIRRRYARLTDRPELAP